MAVDDLQNALRENWPLAKLSARMIPTVGRGKVIYYDPTNGVSSNSGLKPKAALGTLSDALGKCTSGDGDLIVALPGTETITTTITISKDDVAIVALRPGRTVIQSTDTSGDATMIDIAASGIRFEGMRFQAKDQVTNIVRIANAAAETNNEFVGCVFVGTGGAAGVNGIKNGSASYAATDTLVSGCYFYDFDGAGIVDAGIRSAISQNNFFIQDGDGAIEIGIAASDLSARKGYIITKNNFIGATTGGDEVAISYAAAEASCGIGIITRNQFAHCASACVEQDVHPEGVVFNYQGRAGAGGALVDPTS